MTKITFSDFSICTYPNFQILPSQVQLDVAFCSQAEVRKEYEVIGRIVVDEQTGARSDMVNAKLNNLVGQNYGYKDVNDAYRWCEIKLAIPAIEVTNLLAALQVFGPTNCKLEATFEFSEFTVPERNIRSAVLLTPPELTFCPSDDLQ